MAHHTILVTGGAGYVGSHTLRYLRQRGYGTVAVDNLSTGWKEAVEDTPLMEGDIRDEKFLRSVFFEHSIDAVVHCAAMAVAPESVKHPFLYYDVNVRGAITLLKVMIEAGVERFVFSSTAATYGEPVQSLITESHTQVPINPYGRSKKMVEDVLRDLKTRELLQFVILRYFNVAGAAPEGGLGEKHVPETHLVPILLKKALVLDDSRVTPFQIFGKDYQTRDGTCIRDYIHPTDLANAHELALQYLDSGGESQALNLGTGSGYTVREVYDAACRTTGVKIEYEVVNRRPGDPSTLVADATEARHILGWRPRYTLDEMLRTAWQWHQSPRF